MARSRDDFHWSDYLIFSIMVAASLGIGIYQSCSGGKQRTQGEYFLGNRYVTMVTIAVLTNII